MRLQTKEQVVDILRQYITFSNLKLTVQEANSIYKLLVIGTLKRVNPTKLIEIASNIIKDNKNFNLNTYESPLRNLIVSMLVSYDYTISAKLPDKIELGDSLYTLPDQFLNSIPFGINSIKKYPIEKDLITFMAPFYECLKSKEEICCRTPVQFRNLGIHYKFVQFPDFFFGNFKNYFNLLEDLFFAIKIEIKKFLIGIKMKEDSQPLYILCNGPTLVASLNLGILQFTFDNATNPRWQSEHFFSCKGYDFIKKLETLNIDKVWISSKCGNYIFQDET